MSDQHLAQQQFEVANLFVKPAAHIFEGLELTMFVMVELMKAMCSELKRAPQARSKSQRLLGLLPAATCIGGPSLGLSQQKLVAKPREAICMTRSTSWSKHFMNEMSSCLEKNLANYRLCSAGSFNSNLRMIIVFISSTRIRMQGPTASGWHVPHVGQQSSFRTALTWTRPIKRTWSRCSRTPVRPVHHPARGAAKQHISVILPIFGLMAGCRMEAFFQTQPQTGPHIHSFAKCVAELFPLRKGASMFTNFRK